MNYGNKKILLTGATGLIGKELIKPLMDLGFEIYAITIDDKNPDNGVYWRKGNLFNADFIRNVMEEIKPKYLLNMAWITTGDYLESDVNYKFLNAGIELLTQFKNNGGKRAVFAGTCFEYKFKNEPLKETNKLEPDKSVYTFCKNKLHELADFYCKMNDISFGYGRIFYVYGNNENKTRLTGMLIDKLSKNEEVIIKYGMLEKDYMYTKDIAGAFAKFIDSNVEGSVNICTGIPITIRDYVLAIGKEMKKESLIKFQDEPSNQPKIIVGNNEKLINSVGYRMQYSLDKAIKEIICELSN